MITRTTLSILCGILVSLAAHAPVSAQEEVAAVKVDFGNDVPSWDSVELVSTKDGLYVLSGADMWLVRKGFPERVTQEDGGRFMLTSTPGSTYRATPAAGGLVVPGGGESVGMAAAWFVEGTSTKPLKTQDGKHLEFQRTQSTNGDGNPCLIAYSGTAWHVYRIDGDVAIEVGYPEGSSHGLMYSLEGRPLFRPRTDSAAMWVLENDKWEPLEGPEGEPLNLSVGTWQGSPQSATTVCGPYIAITDWDGKTYKLRLFHVKGRKATEVTEKGKYVAGVHRLGETIAVELRDDEKKSEMVSAKGTRLSKLKGAPKGDCRLIASGDWGIIDQDKGKGKRRYFRIDEKGADEIKEPKGLENFSVSAYYFMTGHRGVVTVSGTKDGAPVSYLALLDEKGGLTPVNGDFPQYPAMYPNADGVYVTDARKKDGLLFVGN